MNGQEFTTETELLQFRQSSIHGTGAFAKSLIRAGIRIIEYVGERITKQESLRRCEQNNEYIFTLDDETDLDGNVEWNPARLINHSCSPNCDAHVDNGQIWIVTNRDIAPEEEVTFNYGYDLDNYREYGCRCGAVNCVGYIVAEEFFDFVRARNVSATALG